MIDIINHTDLSIPKETSLQAMLASKRSKGQTPSRAHQSVLSTSETSAPATFDASLAEEGIERANNVLRISIN